MVDPGWRSASSTHATRSFPASGLASTARRAPIRTPGGISSSALVDAITPVLGEALGAVRPAATMIIAGLIREEMKVEIEVTAYRG